MTVIERDEIDRLRLVVETQGAEIDRLRGVIERNTRFHQESETAMSEQLAGAVKRADEAEAEAERLRRSIQDQGVVSSVGRRKVRETRGETE